MKRAAAVQFSEGWCKGLSRPVPSGSGISRLQIPSTLQRKHLRCAQLQNNGHLPFPSVFFRGKYIHSSSGNKNADTVIKALIFFRAEPQLTQLQREYAELQERKSSLWQATKLLTDLKELQEDCLDYREENPEEKVVVSTYFLSVSELFRISSPRPFLFPELVGISINV